jgi:hypothetical protein
MDLTTEITTARVAARNWRIKNGYQGRGGVVIVYDGVVQSWCNELRNPEHWAPGCIAVTEEGVCNLSEGGDRENGAKRWAGVIS